MPDVCLVVPCFNEARRLRGGEFLAALQAQPRLAFCFVNDGSGDDTRRVLEELALHCPVRMTVVNLANNVGKAEAVRMGVRQIAGTGAYNFIGYWDADLSTPLSEVPAFLEEFERHAACALVMGARLKRLGADIERSGTRHVLGRVFATMASLALDLPVYDSQCGAKVFRSDAAPAMFDAPFVSRWLFDVELLARLFSHTSDAPTATVIERPVTAWREVSGSKLRVWHMASAPLDLLRIRARYRRPER